MATTKPAQPEVSIQRLTPSVANVTIVGKTPLIVNKMSAKARNTLLLGGRKKTASERVAIKHHPFDEFRDSMYVDEGFDYPGSIIKFPVVAFKSAMATAALVTAGMKKTDIFRMIYVPQEFCGIHGVPKLRMDIVRSSDINKTPDVRTRAVFEDWAVSFDIQFITPNLSLHSVATLLNNAGLVCGVGENRQEKGKGNFGTFETASEIPKHLLDVVDAQRAAIANPEPADGESAELLQEYATALVKSA